jgi:cytochrome d ubiquinol oxidase subunit I
MVFNPSSMDRLLHVLSGAWLAGSFLVISISAYYILKNRHIDFAKSSLKIALVFALFASLFQLYTGHASAVGVSENQPAKLAAMEAQYNTSTNAPLHLFGWVNESKQEVNFGIAIPGMLSYLISGTTDYKVKGLDSFKPGDRPPVNIVFQAYHLMVAIGFALITISLLGILFWWKDSLLNHKWLLWIFVISVLGPQIANQVGWITAEVGRQPWIVYGLLRTSEALSKAVASDQIIFSLILFTIVYVLLFILFIYLLDQKIKHGPEEAETIESEYEHQKQLFRNGNNTTPEKS